MTNSCIRARFKESWQRDLLRAKGGISDYCVIGEIDVQALASFRAATANRRSRSSQCRMDLKSTFAARYCRQELENE